MYSVAERMCVRFLRLVLAHGAPHVVRLGPSIGPLIWGIVRLPGIVWLPSRTRQVRFLYRERYFKGRFNHKGRGRLEIVETHGTVDGAVVIQVRGLNDVMALNIEQVLNEYLTTSQPWAA